MEQMSRKVKNCICLFLVAALLLPSLAVFSFALPKTPIVYVHGENAIYATKEDGTRYAPREEFADELMATVVPELIPDFAKAVLTNNYTDWSAKALAAIAPIYEPISPNPDGTLPEGTDILWHWSPETLRPDDARSNSYLFWWDLRRSPLDVADDLDAYIQAVKQQNNAEKVVLVSCCAGTGVAAAYLTEYGAQDIEKTIFLCNSLHGFVYSDLGLSGNVTVNGNALYRFLLEYDTLGGMDKKITDILFATLKAMNKNASAEEIINLVLKVYDKIGDCFIAPYIRMYLGTALGDVATVDEHFEDYVNYVFPTQELKTEYAAIIAKATEYHETVQKHIDDVLREINDNGTPVYFIAGYGEQTYPIGNMSEYVGDESQSVYWQTLGATTAKVSETLSDGYIAGQTEKGLNRYISPDKQIDASTCMFPEQTWFVKNLRHMMGTPDIMSLIDAIAHTENAKADSLAGFPQFLNAREDHSAVEPAQAVNANDIDWAALEPQTDEKTDFAARVAAGFARILAFFSRVVQFIKRIFGVAK